MPGRSRCGGRRQNAFIARGTVRALALRAMGLAGSFCCGNVITSAHDPLPFPGPYELPRASWQGISAQVALPVTLKSRGSYLSVAGAGTSAVAVVSGQSERIPRHFVAVRSRAVIRYLFCVMVTASWWSERRMERWKTAGK